MEISQQVLPPELLELMQEAEFESVGRIFVESLSCRHNQLELALRLETDVEAVGQRWRLTIENLLATFLPELESGWLAVYDDHYLLWEHADDEVELYVNGKSVTPPEHVSAHFYERHRVAFGEWIPLEKYVSSAGLLFAAQMPQGLFAQGPRRILAQYCNWLNELGKPAYLYESDGLAAYNACREKRSLQLLLLDESYFIGTQFLFQRLTD